MRLKSPPARRVWLAIASACGALLGSGRAEGALPAALVPGFELETLDPSPAGDRFIMVPDATIFPGVSTRVIFDGATDPLSARVAGTSVTPASTSEYFHLGLAAPVIGQIVGVSADLPVVMNQSLTLDATKMGYTQATLVPSPGVGDVEDMRVGLRVAIPPNRLSPTPSWRHFALDADLWVPTGNTETLTGYPAVRARGQIVWSGETHLCCVELQYAVAAGIQGYFADTLAIGHALAVPIRAGFGVRQLLAQILSFGTRLELDVEVPTTASGGYSRELAEILQGIFANVGPLTLDFAAGAGLSDAPGVPKTRVLGRVGYQATFR